MARMDAAAIEKDRASPWIREVCGRGTLTVIARKNTGMGESITVRKVSFGQGVERIFPIHAPVVDHIDVVRTGRVRRAKLYYLRDLKGKAARLRERE